MAIVYRQGITANLGSEVREASGGQGVKEASHLHRLQINVANAAVEGLCEEEGRITELSISGIEI
jgi:hypothetical protein